MAPVAFMVMPFNRKPTGRSETDVPEVVDFDALWDRVFMPVLTDAGYQPVRADQDIGGLIIAEMIQRLTVADVVVADVTLPNADLSDEALAGFGFSPRTRARLRKLDAVDRVDDLRRLGRKVGDRIDLDDHFRGFV